MGNWFTPTQRMLCVRGTLRGTGNTTGSQLSPLSSGAFQCSGKERQKKWLITLYCGEWFKGEKYQMLMDLIEGAADSSGIPEGSFLDQSISRVKEQTNLLGFWLPGIF